MGQPVTIVINAETEAAAKSLSVFLSQTSLGLQRLEEQSRKLRAALNDGWGALPDVREFSTATRAAGESLKTFSMHAGNSRLALMEVGHVARATAEGLAFGIPPSRLLAMEFPRIAQSATMLGISLTTIGGGLLALLPLIITGTFAWSAYNAKQEEAKSSGDLLDQTLFLQRRNLQALNEALDKGQISLQNYLYVRRLLDIGTPSSVRSATKEMGLLGISLEQISAMEKLKKMESEMDVNAKEGIEQERAKAFAAYNERLAQIRELAKQSKQAADERGDAELKAAAELDEKLRTIDKNGAKQKAQEEIEQYNQDQVRQITIAEAGTQKRVGLTAEEFNARLEFLHDLAKKYPQAEKEITAALTAAVEQRNAGIRSEFEQTQRLIELKKEMRRLEQQTAQERLREQFQNPYLSDAQRMGLLNQAGAGIMSQYATNLLESKGADAERQLQLARERNQLEMQYVGILRQMHSVAAQTSFRDQWAGAVEKLKELNNLAAESAQAFQNVFNTAISSISDNITGLIEGTETWQQALENVGRAILHEIINAIVTMAVRWIMTSIMMAVFGEALIESTAALYASAWAGPAILAAIASYGSAATAAPGEVMGALAFSPMVSAASIAGRERGGPVERGRPYIVGERRPELFVPDQSGDILPSVPRMARGAAAAAGQQRSSAPMELHLHQWFNQQQAFAFMRSHPEFRHIVVDHVNQAIGHRLG